MEMFPGKLRSSGGTGTQVVALTVLLTATAVFYVSQGVTHTVVPLRLGSGEVAGLATGAYFLGFMLGAFRGGALIQRVGHIRAYGALAATVVGLVLLIALFDALWLWLVARLLHGAAIAAMAVVVEAWLTSVATARSRGSILALYTVAVYGGIGIGPLLLIFYPYTGWEPFAFAALLLVVAGVPVLLSRIQAPPVTPGRRASLARLLKVSPSSTTTAAVAGLSSGAMTALAPLYGLDLGLDSRGVGLLMSAPVIAGLLLQWPAGRISDRWDRRKVMVGIAGIGAALSWALVAGTSMPLLAVHALFALQQGAMYTLYPLALAHANDWMGPDTDSADIASGLLITYGAAAALGPLIAGAASVAMGPAAGFALTGSGLVLSSAYGYYRCRRYPSPPVADQFHYKLVVDTTPEVFELDSGTVPNPQFEQSAGTPPSSEWETRAPR